LVTLREPHQDDEAHRLSGLLDACHRGLPNLGDRDDELARAVRETCGLVEARLRELGLSYMEAEGVADAVEG